MFYIKRYKIDLILNNHVITNTNLDPKSYYAATFQGFQTQTVPPCHWRTGTDRARPCRPKTSCLSPKRFAETVHALSTLQEEP